MKETGFGIVRRTKKLNENALVRTPLGILSNSNHVCVGVYTKGLKLEYVDKERIVESWRKTVIL